MGEKMVICNKAGKFKCCKGCTSVSGPSHSTPHPKENNCGWGECISAMEELNDSTVVLVRCVKVNEKS
jgi:hypothetical protein